MAKIWLNECRVVGNLGHDSELRYTAAQKPVLSFDIACTKPANEKYNQPEKTTWFKCIVWGRLAEILHTRLKKGTAVYFSGEMNENRWRDKNGVERKTFEIVNYASNHQLIIIQDSRPTEYGQKQNSGYSVSEPPPRIEDDIDPDLPF